MKKLENLQVLRAFAALMVCFFHFRYQLNFDHFPLGDTLFKNGSLGVPIFFVISGFIMVYTTYHLKVENTIQTLKTFIKKRLAKISPLYYILTFAWIFLGGTWWIYFEGQGLQRLIYSLLYLPNNNFVPVLFLGWSLNYEIFFYFIFALSFVLKQYRYVFILSVLSVLILLGLFLKFENAYLKMITNWIMIYFLIGVIFGLSIPFVKINKNWEKFLAVFGMFLFILLFFGFIVLNQFTILAAVFFLLLSFLILDLKLNVPANKQLVYLGNISYSIYLVHPFVEILFRKLFNHYHFNMLSTILIFILEIMVVILCSSITNYFIEKKIYHFILNPTTLIKSNELS